MFSYICWIVAGVLAALNIAGISDVSWWIIVGIAILDWLIVIGIFLVGVIALGICAAVAWVADWTVKLWRKVRA